MKYLTIILFFMAVSFTAQAKTTEIVLTSDNTVILDDAVQAESVNEVIRQVKEIDAKLASGYPIYLFLYTPGGSIQAGAELIEYLDGINRPVHTITLFAASMGFQIVQHMQKRYVLRYGVLMSHKARGSFSGSFGGGIGQMDTRYSLWLRRVSLMDKKTVERTNGKQTLESYINAYSPELWLNGEEAVEQGYADEVVSVKCDASLSGTRDLELNFGMFKVAVKLSKCPMQTAPLSSQVALVTNQGWMDLDSFLQKNGNFNCNTEKDVSNKVIRNNSKTQFQSIFQDPVYEDDVLEPKAKKQEEQLCAKDPSLTLDKLMAAKTKIEKEKSSDPKDNIVYSY